MAKVKDLQVGMKVVNNAGTEFEVTSRQGRKWIGLERVADGRIWFYDNETLLVEKVEVVK